MDDDQAHLEDCLDHYDACRYFGLYGGAYPEELCRLVLSHTMTGVDYLSLSSSERIALHRWAVALGSLPPKKARGHSVLTSPVELVAKSARLAARLTMTEDGAPKLAQRLGKGSEGRSTEVILAAFGRRVYEGVERVDVTLEADDGRHGLSPLERTNDEHPRPG